MILPYQSVKKLKLPCIIHIQTFEIKLSQFFSIRTETSTSSTSSAASSSIGCGGIPINNRSNPNLPSNEESGNASYSLGNL